MNTRLHWLNRSHRATQPVAAVLAVIFAVVPCVPMAQPPSDTSPEYLSAKVPLADLNLTTPEGARAAHERLKEMAQRLCGKFRDDRTASAWETYADCTHDTLEATIAQLKASVPNLPLEREALRPL